MRIELYSKWITFEIWSERLTHERGPVAEDFRVLVRTRRPRYWAYQVDRAVQFISGIDGPRLIDTSLRRAASLSKCLYGFRSTISRLWECILMHYYWFFIWVRNHCIHLILLNVKGYLRRDNILHVCIAIFMTMLLIILCIFSALWSCLYRNRYFWY